ncbi:HD domain-containing protein [Lactobacillus sp. Sy-1]|uniref:HD domain-containing protein n=1 Tax=Lactobacillus sp. Sy-1 TaxID=2109645 RepID=UPI001C5846F7|nr:HD domain-containing protein [Lactobacillus sp. Sy-1]MBW1604907.1 HD domain-containing protein [Lactobacillus sp. Sy-1]
MEIAFDQVAPYVKSQMQNDHTGHNYDHIERVVNNVQSILVNESRANALVALTAAYMHDLIDDKLFENPGKQIAIVKSKLQEWHYSGDKIDAIMDIIEHMSFSKNLDYHYELSVEGQIVQDADRLDAIGAVGIARAFYYGGHVGEKMYDPGLKPRTELTQDEYRNPTTIVNHFYEKLLNIKNSLNTDTAREMARVRQKVMQEFLTEFKVEWGN